MAARKRSASSALMDLSSDEEEGVVIPLPPEPPSKYAKTLPVPQPPEESVSALLQRTAAAGPGVEVIDVDDVVDMAAEEAIDDSGGRRTDPVIDEGAKLPTDSAETADHPRPSNQAQSRASRANSEASHGNAETPREGRQGDLSTASPSNDSGEISEAGISSGSEDGEIEEASGEIGKNTEDLVFSAVREAFRAGGKDIEQHNARYYTLDNVVCSNCGVKGHMSFDCPEVEDAKRCFLCGKPGHDSKSCPDEACFYCGMAGHRKRDCPTRTSDRAHPRGAGPRPTHIRFGVQARRRLSPPRTISLYCYVCGAKGHVDCSLAESRLSKAPRSNGTPRVSCCNCGEQGHVRSGCPEPPPERWSAYVTDLQREKRNSIGGEKGERSSQGMFGARAGSRTKLSKGADESKLREESIAFREEMKRAVRSTGPPLAAMPSGRGRSWRDTRQFGRH